MKKERVVNTLKATIYINVHILVLCLGFLLSKVLYNRQPNMVPAQFLTLRGVISTIYSILVVHVNLKKEVWDNLPEGCFVALIKRSLQGCCLILVQFTIVKHLSLVYIGLAQNIAPLVTIVLSYFMIGEQLKRSDFLMIGITFVGVTLITFGFDEKAEVDGDAPLLAKLGAFCIPLLLSYGNILMRQMAGLGENTVSLYLNFFLTLAMLGYTNIQGLSLDFLKELGPLDWALAVVVSVNSVVAQTLKFIALQNEQPAKLSHY